MSLISWSDSYSVRVASFDEQHKKLIVLIDELYHAMKQEKTKDVMENLLKELAKYTVYHFKGEEELMLQYNYPEMVTHKKEHDVFVKMITDYQDQFIAGKKTISLELFNFLCDWLINHINGTDKKYGAFFNSKGLS